MHHLTYPYNNLLRQQPLSFRASLLLEDRSEEVPNGHPPDPNCCPGHAGRGLVLLVIAGKELGLSIRKYPRELRLPLGVAKELYSTNDN